MHLPPRGIPGPSAPLPGSRMVKANVSVTLPCVKLTVQLVPRGVFKCLVINVTTLSTLWRRFIFGERELVVRMAPQPRPPRRARTDTAHDQDKCHPTTVYSMSYTPSRWKVSGVSGTIVAMNLTKNTFNLQLIFLHREGLMRGINVEGDVKERRFFHTRILTSRDTK